MKEKNSQNTVFIDSDFYKDNIDFYNKSFMDMPGVSWNWAAFVFGSGWLAYRRMYGWAAVFAAVEVVLGAVVVVFPESVAIVSASTFTVQLILGLFGNALYYRRVKKLSAKTENMSKSERKDFIIKHGGSSVKAVVIFAVICSICSLPMEIIIELFFVA